MGDEGRPLGRMRRATVGNLPASEAVGRMRMLTDQAYVGDVATGSGSIFGLVVWTGSEWEPLTSGPRVVSLTIATGSIALPTHTQPAVWVLRVDVETGTADDLDNITGGVDGDMVQCFNEDSGRDVTYKDASGGAGQMQLQGDFAATAISHSLSLVRRPADIWNETSRVP